MQLARVGVLAPFLRQEWHIFANVFGLLGPLPIDYDFFLTSGENIPYCPQVSYRIKPAPVGGEHGFFGQRLVTPLGVVVYLEWRLADSLPPWTDFRGKG